MCSALCTNSFTELLIITEPFEIGYLTRDSILSHVPELLRMPLFHIDHVLLGIGDGAAGTAQGAMELAEVFEVLFEGTTKLAATSMKGGLQVGIKTG